MHHCDDGWGWKHDKMFWCLRGVVGWIGAKTVNFWKWSSTYGCAPCSGGNCEFSMSVADAPRMYEILDVDLIIQCFDGFVVEFRGRWV